ncbi:hypothetical protein ACFVZM_06765 [Streptomyces sioyaensis]|uniref:aggregation-promoting factor C-terminal-like domain-containing protein n=1 Tax=Streptomyces sioyaensis TaxID=67364 RepID=UPI0036AE2FF9
MANLDIVGSAAVDVVPIAPTFHEKLKAIVLPIADKVGEEAGRKMGEAISNNIVVAIPSAINQGGQAARVAAARQGENTGGTFANSIRRKLEVAFKAMPKLDIRLSDTGVDAQLARVRAKLEQLSNKRIGVDVGAEEAAAEVERLEEQLRRLGAAHPNVAVRVDTAAARAVLADIREEIAAATARPGTIRLEVDGALGSRLRAAVAQAQAALPEINVDADTSPARAQVQALRAQLGTLADQRIGIDIEASTALARVAAVRTELDALTGNRSVDVDVRADAQAASAELAAVHAQVEALDGKRIRFDVDAGAAQSALMSLGIQMAATAAIPLGPIIAAGLGAVTSAAVAAGAGLGAVALAAVPSISAVKNALTAQKVAQRDAAKATNDGGQAAQQAAQKALTMAGAQQSLASAHRSAAQSIVAANRRVQDAERAVGEAAQRAAEQRKQAADGVKRAEQSLADAQRGVRQAEESLTDAQKSARQAQDDLTTARKTAAEQLKALDDQLADGALSQRDATLRVQAAQQDLQTTIAESNLGKATQLQVEQAQLAYDQAVQHAKEQKQDYADLQKSAAAQKKAGVEGSDAVRQAMDRLGTANRAVRDQTESVTVAQQRVTEQMQALRDAEAAVSRARVDGAKSIADAQRRVSDAVQAAANAQVNAADQIASAERGVASARLSGAHSTSQAATKTDAYRAALAKLTPEQRRLFDSIAGPNGLKSAFDGWQKSLQPYVIPIFTRAVGSLKKTLPSLTPLAKGAASGIKELQDRAAKQVKTPFWQDFKQEIQKNAKPAIVGLGVAFGNILKGIAGIIRAFLPHMGSISASMQGMAKRFADWGKNLKGSPAFEKFLRYAKETAPVVGDALGKMLSAFFNVSRAISPISGPLLTVVGAVADFIGTIAEHAPWMIQIIYAVIVAVKLWTLAQIALNLAMDANPITLVILAIGAIVAAVIYCYNKFTWFKNVVDGVWRGISIVVGWAWRTFLRPTFDAWSWIIGQTGDKISWLWKHIVGPIFGWIGDRIKWVYEHGIKPQLFAWKWGIEVVGGIISWLWNKIVSPIFGWIGDRIRWAWRNFIQPNLDAWRWIIGKVGEGTSWLWEKKVRPVFKWIADRASWLWNLGIKPTFSKIKSMASQVGEAFQALKEVIRVQWEGLVDILRKPARLVIETVYNRGIVPLWNGVAKVTGAGRINPVDLRGFHTGGIMPGYSPGVDNSIIAVGGGEAIMRPEWTRAVGPDYVHTMNAAARSGGVSAVRRAVNGGMPAFADGGIVGLAKKTWDYATDPMALFEDMKKAANGLIGGLAKNPWIKNVGQLPGVALDELETKALSWLGLAGNGVANVSKALDWAYSQVGKPYQWGGAGNPSWDCSGFMSGIQKVIQGRDPRGRLWSTFDFQGSHAPAGWKKDLPAPYMIGVTNRGKGHTAGTLAGVNVESRGGDGVVMGKRARGARSSFFDSVYGFQPSLSKGGNLVNLATAQKTAQQMLGEFGWGASQWLPLRELWQHESGWRWNAENPGTGAYGIPQALPGKKMASVAADWRTNPATQIKWGLQYIKSRPDYGSPARAWAQWQARSPHWYDDGGYLQPGMTMVANGTGRPEPVFTSTQWDTLKANVGGGGRGDIHVEARVFVGDREITDIVRTEIHAQDALTASQINDGRWV